MNVADCEQELLVLDHLSIRVADLSRSVDFYSRLLGLQVVSSVDSDYAHLSFTGGADKVLSLVNVNSTSQAARYCSGGGTAHFAFKAASLKQFYLIFQELKRALYAHQLVDHGSTWAVYFEDPDGHRIEIFLWRNDEARAAWRGTTRSLAEEVIEIEYQRVNVAS